MLRSIVVLFLALAVGCAPNSPTTERPEDGKETPSDKPDPAARAVGKKYVLPAEPTAIKGVIDIRKQAKDGDEVTVIGQVGGSSKPFTEGRAAFLIVDKSFPISECECPWDFCETPKKELAAGRLSVKFVEDGKTVATGARGMFGIKELSTVVIKGKVQRDDKDNVIVVASGIYVRPDQP